ncbi:MAG: B12-binding domain-containing radical SAM protein [Candidatus Omnitrophica bacterium]|nr:B12-binding domain-containing radical SAM protein [Candidatus Omnitrophota bacterium]
MKVTFIYPSIALSGFKASSGETLLRNIHHGLCYLSACAKMAGFATELIDLSILSGWDHFRREVESKKIEVAAITIMSPDFPYAIKAVDIIKEVNPRAVIIVGGIHPTIAPEELTSNPKIDYIVRCEGEKAFVSLLESIKSGKKAQKVIFGEQMPMDELPYIDRYLFDCLESPWDFFMPMPFFTIMAGRGCSYNCRFCAPASKMVHGKGSRRRSIASVMAELKELENIYGMKSFMFHDDCFTEDEKWVMEFCDAYRQAGFRLPFICQTRADIICRHPDMIRKLAHVGLRMAQIGFESGNDRVLRFISKGVTLKQNLEAARICHSNGIRIFANYMLGLPTETNAEAWDTVRMIKKIKPYRASAAFFTPHPGSYLYDYCKEKNLSLIDDHEDVVPIPEEDKPKIKGVDYAFLKTAVAESRKLPLRTKIMERMDKALFNRHNRRFLRMFRDLVGRYPGRHKLDLLRMIKEGRI